MRWLTVLFIFFSFFWDSKKKKPGAWNHIINTNDRDEKKIDAGRPLELVTSKEGE